MTDNATFDEGIVKHLAEILKETDLTEIEVERNDWRVRVARQINISATIPAVAHGMPQQAPHVMPAAPMGAVQETASPAAADPATHPGAVKSPMVGNAYLSPAPGSAPFIREGDSVKEGDSILIIEAMKVMNQIKAPRDGVVTKILIRDGDPVEFDEPLVIIE